MARVESPCVRNCCLDREDICLGCHRSIDEIVTWSAASDEERRGILRLAEDRAARRRGAPAQVDGPSVDGSPGADPHHVCTTRPGGTPRS